MVFRTCVCVCVVGSLRFVRMGQSNGHVIKQLCWRSDRKWDKRNELRHQFSSWQNTYSWTHCRIIIAYYVFFFLPAVVAASFATCAIVCVCACLATRELPVKGSLFERFIFATVIRATHHFPFCAWGWGLKRNRVGHGMQYVPLLFFFSFFFLSRSDLYFPLSFLALSRRRNRWFIVHHRFV